MGINNKFLNKKNETALLKKVVLMNKIKELIANPWKILYAILVRLPQVSIILSDRAYIRLSYRALMKKKLNLLSPTTFNEKLQWMKLYDRNPIYTDLVDKYTVKKHVSKLIGEEYIIPTYGVWEHFDDINFDELPNQFVLKCTHDSGGLVICKDKNKLDLKKAKKKITTSLKRDFFAIAREWPYKNVKRQIIAEQYMEDDHTQELRDYKFYTFGGEPKYLLLATNRQNENEELSFDYFDMNFKHLDIVNRWHPNNKVIPEKPTQFEKMKELAKSLSQNIPQVRVDFYEVNGKVYFGEMTFFDNGGYLQLSPESWEEEWGKLIDLKQKVKCSPRKRN